MARSKAALILLGLLCAAPAAASEPPALEGNSFVFQRPRVVTRQYTVQFHDNGRGTLLVDALDERRLYRVPGSWAWRHNRLCLEFPPSFSHCVMLIRQRDFFLMARADARSETVQKRNANAPADPHRYAAEGSWGSNPDLLGTGVFVAGQ